MAKRQYSDDQKAAALLALEANGGVVAKTAKETGIPRKTIEAWRDGKGTPEAVAEIRHEKRPELIDRFMNELHAVLDLMPEKRHEATYSDLARAAGIYTDKVQLLSGKPTERTDGQQKIIIEYVNPDDTD